MFVFDASTGITVAGTTPIIPSGRRQVRIQPAIFDSRSDTCKSR